jgi:FtsP/CotA-like multicopper oxidase with cupredoxin domain
VSEGPPRYCYVTDDGIESPTLRVNPGDQLIIHLHNDLPSSADNPSAKNEMMPMTRQDDCDTGSMDLSTTNLHFHGMTIPPTCHQDEVIRTAIHAGQVFDYDVTIPADEKPGLYWYHPHPHGFGERQVQGGASGAIIVEGIEKMIPAIASYAQRIIVLRDQQRIGMEANGPAVPTWDISANFVPVTYPGYTPAVIETASGQREFWRVVNAGADTIFNLQFVIDGVPRTIDIISIDGVAISSRIQQTNILLPPGARAEFLATTPKQGHAGQLVTQAWDTGPAGDNDPKRPIANLVPSSGTPRAGQETGTRGSSQPRATNPTLHRTLTRQRTLYFSQRSSNPQDPDNFILYFLTVQGQTPQTYKMGSSPNIVVHQGDIEEWTVENRSSEDHVFHIHQVHFNVVEVNGKAVYDPATRDTIDLPYWDGEGPYPSVKLRMDFSDRNSIGTFLYHCHILKHEDMGMMGSIQVLPRTIVISK